MKGLAAVGRVEAVELWVGVGGEFEVRVLYALCIAESGCGIEVCHRHLALRFFLILALFRVHLDAHFHIPDIVWNFQVVRVLAVVS